MTAPGKQSFVTVFFFVILITALRVFSECLLLDYPFEIRPDQIFRFYLENIYYFMIVFLVISATVSAVTHEKILPLMHFGLKFFPLIIVPPWIDHFLMGRTEGYHYATPGNFFSNFFTISFAGGDSTLGISLEILLGVSGLGVFIFHKTKKPLPTAGAILFIYWFILMLSTPAFFFPEEADFASDIFLQFYYFFPFLIWCVFFLWKSAPEKLWAALGNLRPLRASAFVIASLAGGLAAYYLGYRINDIKLIYAAWTIFLLWETSVVVNDLCDLKIDAVSNKHRPLVTGVISSEEYRTMAFLFSFLTLSFAATINFAAFALSAGGLLLAVVYSAPPLRLRKNITGYPAIGAAFALSFFIGLVSAPYVGFRPNGNVWSFALFLLGYGSLIPMAKDLKDIEGDRQNGVINLFTRFGKKRGKKIYLIIFFIAQTILATMLTGSVWVPAAVALAICAVYHRTESLKFVYSVGILSGLILFFKVFAL